MKNRPYCSYILPRMSKDYSDLIVNLQARVKEKEMKMNLTEKLINEVKIRPMFWNKYNDMYNNRTAMDLEWGRLSIILAQDKDFIRQKWKNLRDQFQKELKKMKSPNQEASIENYKGKWVYFGQMLFLKDVVKSGKDTNTIVYTYPEIEIKDDEDIKEELLVFEEQPLAAQVLNAPVQFQIVDPETYSMSETNMIDELSGEENVTEELPRQKRKASASPVSKNSQGIKVRKLSEDPNNIDDDLHFAKSLVPFFKRLNPIRKLMVRNEIQTILLRENLCDKCNEHSCTNVDE